MSTARTTVGCMAEDHASDLGRIVREWAAMKRDHIAQWEDVPDELEQRLLDVADSFVMAAKPPPVQSLP